GPAPSPASQDGRGRTAKGIFIVGSGPEKDKAGRRKGKRPPPVLSSPQGACPVGRTPPQPRTGQAAGGLRTGPNLRIDTVPRSKPAADRRKTVRRGPRAFSSRGSLQTQEQIQSPPTAHVGPRPAEVIHQFLIGAAGLNQRVGQYGQCWP